MLRSIVWGSDLGSVVGAYVIRISRSSAGRRSIIVMDPEFLFSGITQNFLISWMSIERFAVDPRGIFDGILFSTTAGKSDTSSSFGVRVDGKYLSLCNPTNISYWVCLTWSCKTFWYLRCTA